MKNKKNKEKPKNDENEEETDEEKERNLFNRESETCQYNGGNKED